MRRSTRPFALIEHALQEHAAGRTDTRLPRLSGKEARSIARRFNEMADALAGLHRQRLAWAQAQAYQQAQRHYTYRLQADRELERKQLAATLHDEFSQSLTALRSVSHVLGMAQVDQQRQRDAVALIQHSVERMQLVLRGLLSSLRPAALDGLGLAMAVEDLLAQYRQFHPQLQLRFHSRTLPSLPEALQMHAYRLVQEACTNAIRHGACQNIRVSLRASAAALHLRIADDGCGRADAIAPRAGHFGVIGMVERAQALGGSVRWLARPGSGVVVLARLPLSHAPVPPQEGRA
ncbi:HAMP domain-containing sensor histidine kinase [Lampropedia cohaerens]|uniref:HAMP domain-containing sensor histidine kinase n=1 Tax=Lampropedia cohaerens TaxID=1610491 RepID=UPI00069C2952|nr:ATP-binding protein [Lampropedia cohaerens]